MSETGEQPIPTPETGPRSSESGPKTTFNVRLAELITPPGEGEEEAVKNLRLVSIVKGLQKPWNQTLEGIDPYLKKLNEAEEQTLRDLAKGVIDEETATSLLEQHGLVSAIAGEMYLAEKAKAEAAEFPRRKTPETTPKAEPTEPQVPREESGLIGELDEIDREIKVLEAKVQGMETGTPVKEEGKVVNRGAKTREEFEKELQESLKEVTSGLTNEDRARLEELYGKREDLMRRLAAVQMKRWQEAGARRPGFPASVTELPGMPKSEGMIALPPVEAIGPELYQKEFHRLLTSLVEDNVDQSFDANWRLTYPLEIAITSLQPKFGQSDDAEFVHPDGRVEKFNYKILRRSLSEKLSAFRSCHNHAYIYTRVGGVDSLIEASHLLRLDQVRTLFSYPEIRASFQTFEEMGERYYSKLKEEQALGTQEEKRKATSSKERILAEMKALAKSDWRGIIAGNLFSSLGEAPRMDINLDRAGDFFLGRIYHMTDRARTSWEGNWMRKPYPEFYKAVDLKIYPFFMDALTSYKKALGKDFGRFCASISIDPLAIHYAPAKDEKGNPITKDVVGASLKRADFLKMLSHERRDSRGEGLGMVLPENALTLAHLDLADAENMRKLIINPGGFLQNPTFISLLDEKLNEVTKHLKGEKRYQWFEDVGTALVRYLSSSRLPLIEALPSWLRTGEVKEDFPDFIPWSIDTAMRETRALSPVVNRKHADNIMARVFGPEWKVMLYGKKATYVVSKGIWEMAKGALKDLVSMK